MTTILLIRHGRTTANARGVLAGWTPGVGLDQIGREQADALAARLADVPVTHLVTSPLQRTVETARALAVGRNVKTTRDKRLGECDYGDWTNTSLKKLAKNALWAAVQVHPSSVTFPGGESMPEMQTRAVAATRDWSARGETEAGDAAIVAIVSHGDVIKAILADALGMHLDAFQRIVVDPGSLSVIRYSSSRPTVERVNDVGGSIDGLLPAPEPKKSKRHSASRATSRVRRSGFDAVLGGGTGPSARRR